jgi:hypothetical protein
MFQICFHLQRKIRTETTEEEDKHAGNMAAARTNGNQTYMYINSDFPQKQQQKRFCERQQAPPRTVHLARKSDIGSFLSTLKSQLDWNGLE